LECGVGVVGRPHPLGFRSAHPLGQVVTNISQLVELSR
jgi:hypothetical protein